MPSHVRVVWNPEFLVSDVIRVAMEEPGPELVALAQELAPRKTSDLANSIVYEVEIEETAEGPKQVGKLYATDFKGGWMELGTVLDVPHPFLSPAVMQVIGNLH